MNFSEQPSSTSTKIPASSTSISAAFVRAAEMMETSRLSDLYLVYTEGNKEKFEAVSVSDQGSIDRAFCSRSNKNIIFASLVILFQDTPAILFGRKSKTGQIFELYHQSDIDGAEEFLTAITVK